MSMSVSMSGSGAVDLGVGVGSYQPGVYMPLKALFLVGYVMISAKEAIKLGTSPIIIDNTNTQKWEFKPYVSMVIMLIKIMNHTPR